MLYGDGAVGGVINIVTKNGVGAAAVGAHRGALRLVQLSRRQRCPRQRTRAGRGRRRRSTATRSAPTAIARTTSCASATASAISATRPSRAPAPISTSPPTTSISACRAAAASSRRSARTSSSPTARGAATPFDFGREAGHQRHRSASPACCAPGTELIVDGGVRHKEQQARLLQRVRAPTSTRGCRGPTLTTLSFTPRIKLEPAHLRRHAGQGDRRRRLSITSIYNSDRSLHLGDRRSIATTSRRPRSPVYWPADGCRCCPTPTSPFGVPRPAQRDQRARSLRPECAGRRLVRFGAAKACRSTAAKPITPSMSASSIASTSMSRCSAARRRASACPMSTSASAWSPFGVADRRFDLQDPEIARLRRRRARCARAVRPADGASTTWSWTDEIHFSSGRPSSNTNLDPTQRYGIENDRELARQRHAAAQGRPRLYARGVPRRAVRRQRRAAGVALDRQRRRVLGHLPEVADVRRGRCATVGDRRMDNDQANLQPLIPAHTVVDVRHRRRDRQVLLVGRGAESCSTSIYFDYAIASAFTLGTYNAYPQPGRTYPGAGRDAVLSGF